MSSSKTRDFLPRRHHVNESKDRRAKRAVLGDTTNVSQAEQAACSSRTNSSIEKMPAPGKRQRLLLPHPVHRPDSTDKLKSTANWTSEEDETLIDAVGTHKARNWKLIAENLPNRTDVQCLHRWQKVLNPILVKGYWTKEEDERMVELVGMFGTKRWAAIARSLPGRNGKQCRERWCNHLDPEISRDAWSDIEDMMLFLAHERFGNKWAEISKLLPGRSDNGIKNRWNTAVKKRAKEFAECTKFLDMQNPELLPTAPSTHDDSKLVRDGPVLPPRTDHDSKDGKDSTVLPVSIHHDSKDGTEVPDSTHRDSTAGRNGQVEQDGACAGCQALKPCSLVRVYSAHQHSQRDEAKRSSTEWKVPKNRTEPSRLRK